MQRSMMKAGPCAFLVFCSSAVHGASGLAVETGASAIPRPYNGVVLAQSATDISEGNNISASNDDELIDANQLTEEQLLEFLSDPEAFINNPENAEFVAAAVRQAIVRDPENADVMIALAERVSDPNVIDAIAEGVVQAASDFAETGNTEASSAILAKTATSQTLGEAVTQKSLQVASLREAIPTEDLDAPEQVTEDDVQVDDTEPQTDIVAEEQTQEPAAVEEPVADADANVEENTATTETLSEPASEAPALSDTASSGASGVNTGSTSTSSTSSSSSPSNGTQASSTTTAASSALPSSTTSGDTDAAVTPSASGQDVSQTVIN